MSLEDIDFGMARIAAIDGLDILPTAFSWPNVQKGYLTKRHLKQMERLNFMAFLIGNGVDPEVAVRIVLYPGSDYDRAGVRHVMDLAKLLPQRHISTTYYDLNLSKYVNLMTGQELGKGNPYEYWPTLKHL